jgi:hypothetical protein
MKKKVLLVTCALVLAVIGAVKSKAVFAVRYIDTVNPNTCLIGAPLPSDCTTVIFDPVILCVTPLGAYERRYYTGSTCVNPFYRIPQ